MIKVICFHNPDEINGYLSNWYLSDFRIDNIGYSSMEQYMMHRKALIFNDTETAGQILDTSNVGKIKTLGRGVKNYDDIIWNGMRQPIVCRGLMGKFGQNAGLKEMLFSIGDNILAECAVKDNIWGIGLSMKDEKRFELSQWQGWNLLGFSLMYVRDILKKAEK